MRCQKCQHENAEGEIFCEECDHQLGRSYVPERRTPPMILVIIAVALGAIAIVFGVLIDIGWYVPIGTGAVGLLLGTYTLSIVRLTPMDDKRVPMAMTITAILLSMIGFIMGFSMY